MAALDSDATPTHVRANSEEQYVPNSPLSLPDLETSQTDTWLRSSSPVQNDMPKQGETATTPSRISPRRKSKDEATRRIARICNATPVNEICHASSSLDPDGFLREESDPPDARNRRSEAKERAPDPCEFLVQPYEPSPQQPFVAYSGSMLSDPLVAAVNLGLNTGRTERSAVIIASSMNCNVAPRACEELEDSVADQAVVIAQAERSAVVDKPTDEYTRASSLQVEAAVVGPATDQADVTEDTDVVVHDSPNECTRASSLQVDEAAAVDESPKDFTRASSLQVEGEVVESESEKSDVLEEAERSAAVYDLPNECTRASSLQVQGAVVGFTTEQVHVTEQAERSAVIRTNFGIVPVAPQDMYLHIHHGFNMFTCATSRPCNQDVCVVASRGKCYKSSPAQANKLIQTKTPSNSTTEVDRLDTHNHIAKTTPVLNADDMPPRTRRTPRSTQPSASNSSAPSGNDDATQDDSTHAHGQPQLPTPDDESDTVDLPIPPSTTTIRLRTTQGVWREDGRSVRADRAPLDLNRLTGDHVWCHTLIERLSFHDFVTNGGAARRPDMERWAALVDHVGLEAAEDL